MRTYKRICIQDYNLEDKEGNQVKLKRGSEYLTSESEDNMVIVFTDYWVKVPDILFAGEVIFT